MALEIYDRDPIDFSNYEEDLENTEVTTTTTLPPLDIKTEEELDYLNQTLESWQGDPLVSFPSFTPLMTDEPPGGTADVEFKVKKVENADIFSKDSWFGLKYIGAPFGQTPKTIVEKDAGVLMSNYIYLNKFSEINNNDLNVSYVESIFNYLDKKPTFESGATIDNIADAMKDPKVAAYLIKEAQKLEKLPEVSTNSKLKWSLEVNHVKHALLNSLVASGQEIINSGLKYAAQNLNAEERVKNPGYTGFDYTSILDENGAVLSEKVYAEKVKKESAAKIEKFKKENYDKIFETKSLNGYDFTLPRIYNFTPVDNTYVRRPFVRDEKGKYTAPQPTQVNWSEEYNRLIANEDAVVKSKIKSFNERVKKLTKTYDKNSQAGINSIRTQFESFDNPYNTPLGNRGGRRQATPAYIEYNLYQGDKKGNEEKYELENKEYSNLVKSTVDKQVKDKILYNIGTPLGTLPEEQDVELANVFKEIYEQSVNKEGSSKALSKPSGNITFQSIAGGTKDYHAYTITFDNDFTKKLIGTKDDPGPLYKFSTKDIELFKNKGITMYVPTSHATKVIYEKRDENGNLLETYYNKLPVGVNSSEFSKKVVSRFADENKKAEKVTVFETQLYLGKPLTIDIPGAGKRTIVYDKEKKIIKVNGFNRIFMASTKKYDQEPLEEITLDYARSFDLENLVGGIMAELKNQYIRNDDRYNQLLGLQQ